MLGVVTRGTLGPASIFFKMGIANLNLIASMDTNRLVALQIKI